MALLDALRSIIGRPDRTDAGAIERAITLLEGGDSGGAEAACRAILARAPHDPDAHHLLGLIAHRHGDQAAALEHIMAALDAAPDRSLFHLNLGNVRRARNEAELALAGYREAVRLDPQRVDAWFNLAHLALDQGDLPAACDAFRQALRVQPDLAAARVGLVEALFAQRAESAADEAIALLEPCWQAAPDADRARFLLAQGYRQRGRLSEAAGHLEALAARFAGAPDIHNQLANCYNKLGRPADAIAAYRRTHATAPDFHAALTSILGCLNYLPRTPPERILAAHREWARTVAPAPEPAARHFANDRTPHRRLRIGYVSPDLRRHPVSALFAPVLGRHDPAAIESFCYYSFPRADAMTARLRGAAHQWRDIAPLDDNTVVALVRADAIDILVDLAGHTTGTRLPVFAARPAPVQASWLGYFNTTGLDAMDWFVSDPVSSPAGQDAWFVERLVRLPATRFPYEPPKYMPPVTPLPAAANGFVTFGCCNNLSKVNEDVLDAWAAILAAVPRARLLLQASALSDAPNRERFAALAASRGIPGDRLELRPFVPEEQAPIVYAAIDIALDPFPFGGGMTSFDALWMGVPVVTWAQPMIAGRQTASMLANLGLGELIATSAGEYVGKAVRLAADPAALATLRSGLRERFRASPLMDYDGFTRALEDAYRMMWRHWLDAAKGDG